MQRLHRMVRAALAALLVGMGLCAHALVPTSTYYETYGGLPNYATSYSATGSDWFASCDAWLAAWPDATTAVTKIAAYETYCNFKLHRKATGEQIFGNSSSATRRLVNACPANSTAVTGGCQCKSGFKESGNQCVPDTNPCTAKVGSSSIVNWTTGWTRTPNDNDFGWVGGPAKYPGYAEAGCSGGCSVEVDGTKPEGAYISQTPTAQGLYRNSGDYMAKFTGQQCTPAAQNDPLNPQAENVKCPGYVGEGPSGIGCYGTAQQPVHISNVPRPQTPSAGNPAAGAKPATGEGSGTGSVGRTPSTGTGGNSGGPAAAGQGGAGGGAGGAATKPGTGGGTGGGTGPGTEEPKPCGAPGQPVCNVKVDESGMPALDGTFGNLNDQVSKLNEHALIKGGIDAIVARGDLAPQWSWSFALPTGCAPYVMQAFNLSVNVCQWQPVIHDLMSMVWLGATIWFLIGLFLKSET